MARPYTEEKKDGYLIREFSQDTPSFEFVWHRDKEDRDITLKEGEEWYIQMDNELPVLMSNDNVYKIPSYTWHRIINKDRTKLIIEVKKYT